MKKVFLAIILLTATAFATTQGPSFPGTAATAGSGPAWTSVNNIKANDGVMSSVSLTTSNGVSQFLQATNFGFTIPAGATIQGIQMSVNWSCPVVNFFNSANQNSIFMLKGGVASGTNKSTAGFLPTSQGTDTFGSTSDLWGNTLTPSDINAANFGVEFAVQDSTGSGLGSASVDWVQVTITYSVIAVKTVAETVTVTSVVGLNGQSSTSDTLSISPAASVVYGAHRSTPESVGISPAVSYIHNGKSVTSDTVTLSDSSIRVAGLHFSLSESIGVAPSVLIVFPRAASESISLVDTIAIRQAPKRNFSESIALSTSGVGSAAGVRAVSESVTLTDASVRQVTLGRSLADSGAFTDTFTRRFAYKPGPIEVVNIVGITNLGYVGRPFVDVQVQDLTLMSHAARPLLPESLTLSPSVIVSLPRFKLISEPLGLNPTTLTSHAAHRATAEFGTWRDVISSTTINVTPHSEKNTIGQSVTLSEVLVVSVRSSTKKRAVIVMSL